MNGGLQATTLPMLSSVILLIPIRSPRYLADPESRVTAGPEAQYSAADGQTQHGVKKSSTSGLRTELSMVKPFSGRMGVSGSHWQHPNPGLQHDASRDASLRRMGLNHIPRPRGAEHYGTHGDPLDVLALPDATPG